jgi:hypothetical protein
MNRSDDPAKWLRLGYETYGPAGARAVAEAMGLIGAQGSGDGGSAQQYRHVSDRAPISPSSQQPAQCPPGPPRNQSQWRPYVGDPDVFHCGFEGYLENRDPSPSAPIGECFYDKHGRLVGEGHPYSGCRGTPDSYGADDPRHLWPDPGGVVNEGWEAYWESQRYFEDEKRRLQEKLNRPYWRQRDRHRGSGSTTSEP